MNLGTLRTQAASFLGDPGQTRYTADQYNSAANLAQTQFALDTRALWSEQSYTTSDGTASYALPSDFMFEDWATYDGKELVPINRHNLQRIAGQDWASRTGDPTHLIVDPEEGQKNIVLWPTPVEAKTVILRYYPLPAALSSDSAVPLNSSALLAQFHIGIAAYSAWLLLMSEEITPAIQVKMDKVLKVYNDAITQAIDLFGNTASAPIEIRGSRLWY